MISLYKAYKDHPLKASGTAASLNDLLIAVRTYWPEAHMEASTGYDRSFFLQDGKLVAVASGKRKDTTSGGVNWRYRVLKTSV